MAPSLPGYGFVRLDVGRPGWQGAWRVPYVVRLIGPEADHPTPIPDRVVDGLRSLPRGGDPRPVLVPALVPVGARVRFTEGAWANHQGECILSDARRADIAVAIFGRLTTIGVTDPRTLEVVSTPRTA